MDKIIFINKKLDELIKNGSNVEDIEKIKPTIIADFNMLDDKDPDKIMGKLSDEILMTSKEFIESKNSLSQSYLDGLSTGIYLRDQNTGDYKITFLGGKNNTGGLVDNNTKFDIASVTKMFTLLLTFKLVENGFFNLDDKIADLDSRFKGLDDFTINDILKLCGELYTNGNPKDGKTVEEANKILETIYLKDNDRSRNLYTDLGGIVLSKVIEKIVSEKSGKNVTYAEIMDKYIIKPFNLDMTGFNPINDNLAGNGNSIGLVHDPKSRALGGAVGSAGIFTNSNDLAKLAKEMFTVNYTNYNYIKNLVSKDNLIKMGTVTFPDAKQNNKGLLGMYQKNDDRENKWLDPLIYGEHTFTAQGFTGATAIFDTKNQIHNSFLVNSIKDGEPKKPDGFLLAFKSYEYFIVGKTMELYLIKKYYDTMIQNNSIDKTYTLKLS